VAGVRAKPSGARLGAIGGGVAALVLGGSALVATLVGGKGGAAEGADKEPVGSERPAGDPTQTETEPQKAEPDALCIAHDERVAALDAIGSVDDATELEAFVLAQLAFYSAAAEGEQEPRASAFRSMSGYYDALRSFYEARAWQQADFSDAAQLPQLPADGANTRTSEILAERCGVRITTDTPP
jgi:hypothetical protein